LDTKILIAPLTLRCAHVADSLLVTQLADSPARFASLHWRARCARRRAPLVCMLVLLCVSGCARVKRIDFTDLAGNQCRAVKVKPDWYTGETFIECLRDGKVAEVPAQQTDLSMIGGVAGLGLVAVSLIPLLAL